MNYAALDPLIHAPARLQIMALLAGVNEAEFATLRDAVEVSDSVLSKHLAQLQAAGYVAMRKAAFGGRQRSWLSLTRTGRRAFTTYVKALVSLARVAQRAAE
jgi:DNA-binding transcriptional ArsR family regulator